MSPRRCHNAAWKSAVQAERQAWAPTIITDGNDCNLTEDS